MAYFYEKVSPVDITKFAVMNSKDFLSYTFIKDFISGGPDGLLDWHLKFLGLLTGINQNLIKIMTLKALMEVEPGKQLCMGISKGTTTFTVDELEKALNDYKKE